MAQPAHPRPGPLRAHPGRRRRGHHRRRHLTRLRAGGLRPRRRSRRSSHRGRARARVRAPRAQHREDERDAERAAGVRADTVHEHLAGGLREYVEGNDPIHGRPFMAEVFDQLTSDPGRRAPRRGQGPLDAALRRGGQRTEMHALFQERRYTDFLPIVLPTEERVEQMLTGTSHAPDEMVGKLRSAWSIGTSTSRKSPSTPCRRRALPGPPRARPRAATPGARAACPRWGTWSSSTGRSGRRSA